MKLSDIAEIRTGLVLSRKTADLESDIVAEYKQLNLKCIKDNGEIDLDAVDIYKSNVKLGCNYLTQLDDIIVRLTFPFTAVLITEETTGLVVPSHFCIIRVKSGKAVPAYIKWLLNSKFVKLQVEKNKTGISFSGIKPSFYTELEIKPISMEEQLRIACIYNTAHQELLLLRKLIDQKEKLYNGVLTGIYQQY